MFRQLLIRTTRRSRNVRFFRSDPALRDAKKEMDSVSSATKTTQSVDHDKVIGSKAQKCSDFEKWMLVYFKKYPSKEQIPERVPYDVLEKVKSKFRIRLANVMVCLTLLGCVWAVVTGKKEQAAGKTISQANMDWHAEINREYKASMAAPPKSS